MRYVNSEPVGVAPRARPTARPARRGTARRTSTGPTRPRAASRDVRVARRRTARGPHDRVQASAFSQRAAHPHARGGCVFTVESCPIERSLFLLSALSPLSVPSRRCRSISASRRPWLAAQMPKSARSAAEPPPREVGTAFLARASRMAASFM